MTKIHPETGEILYRDVRPFEFTFRGEKITVDMTGCFGLCVTNHEGAPPTEIDAALPFHIAVVTRRLSRRAKLQSVS